MEVLLGHLVVRFSVERAEPGDQLVKATAPVEERSAEPDPTVTLSNKR
jgi:hypothetical protein